MKLLFVHQNMPGQYRELVQWLAEKKEHEIVFLTQRKKPPVFEGVRTVIYKPHHVAKEKTYGLVRTWENAAGAGFGAAQAAGKLRDDGFTPDIIIGHVGWGELTFIKEIYPNVPVIGFFEYFYSTNGGPVGFDPENPVSEHAPYLMAAHNTVPLVNIEVVDLGHFHEPTTLKTFPFEMIQVRQTVNNQSKFLEFSTKWRLSGHITDRTLTVVQRYVLQAANGLNFA